MTRKLDAEDFRARQVIGASCHGHRHVEATGADGEHGNPGGARCVTVSPQKRLARDTESLHVHLVGYAVPRPAEMDAVAGTGRLQIFVIVRILVIRLKNIVVHILRCQLNVDRVEPQGFKFEHGHGAGSILQQRVVDRDRHLPAAYHLPVNQMGRQDLMGQILLLRHILCSCYKF